jgi:hypothetical protein
VEASAKSKKQASQTCQWSARPRRYWTEEGARRSTANGWGGAAKSRYGPWRTCKG